jgi:antibiotic biosynthesis monooxygenase (ABM) superfamily enzyme
MERVSIVVEHIVCFKLKPAVTKEQQEKFLTALRGLKTAVPGIVDLTAGETFTPERGQGYTIGLVVRFHDREGLAAYGPHPNHQPVKQMVAELCESNLAIDYEF